MSEKEPSLANQIFHHPYTVSIFLFFLALIPRLPGLDRFLTADEFLWVDRSKNFLAGLTNAAYQCHSVVESWNLMAEGLACTLRTGHPGVTTMWTGSFGLVISWLARGRGRSLHEYVVGVSTNPLDVSLVAPERIGTVLLTSVWVVALYWLVRRLMGGNIALVAAVLLALNPFHVALSRVIHHDALSTAFMTLSALAALIYWGQRTERKWLLASGVLAGFGFVSKSPAMYLMVFIALVGLWFSVKDTKQDNNPAFFSRLIALLLKRTIPDGLLWFASAVVTVFIIWPAMWVAPREALETVFLIGTKYATGGHAKGNFFLGEISNDPGWLFYPVTWLYRTSPLVMLGVIFALGGWALRLFQSSRSATPTDDLPAANSNENASFYRFLPLILLFIAGYYLLMSVGEKKQDRYFLPVYPWLDIIAAGGLVIVTQLPAKLKAASNTIRYALLALLLVLVLLLNGYLTASNAPYYFTYYNPLLGGAQGAARAITIGWGEGLDLTADYLNHQMNPNNNRVSSWYESTFAPYYYGPTISYSKEKGKALAGDYVIFYINQVQRRFPDDVLFDYIRNRFPPRQVITLKGLEYAWIYPSLGIDHYVEDQTYTGIASLLAWQWNQGDRPFPAGETVPFELYWEYLGKMVDEPFFFRIVDERGYIWAEGSSSLAQNSNPPLEAWREGEIILERGQITLPVGMPPGQYRLQIGFYTKAPAVTEGELLFTLPPDETVITITTSANPTFNISLDMDPVNQPLNDSLTLLGFSGPQGPVTLEEEVNLDIYWRINAPLPADTVLHMGLMNEAGEASHAWFNLKLAETLNPSATTWQPGDLIRTHWQLGLIPDLAPGVYNFEVVNPENHSEVISFGELTLEP